MKKLLLLTLGVAAATGSFAQKHAATFRAGEIANKNVFSASANPLAKTTGDGDTLLLPANISSTDTLGQYFYNNDSGYVFGSNGFGDKGFAELFAVDGTDSMVQVLGGIAIMGGTYNPAANNTVTFSAWGIGQSAPVAGTNYMTSGLPSGSLASVTVPVNMLGINTGGSSQDSGVEFMFPTPTSNVSAFFLGYELNYSWNALNGDTIGIYSNLDGERTSSPGYINGSDTIILDQTAVEDANGNWNDGYFFTGYYNDLYIAPIVLVHYTGVTNVSSKGLSFYGNYPNPANNSTNIQFGLTNASDVTITVTDMAGRTVNTIAQSKMDAGNHVVNLNTSNLAAGDYIYMISTSNGAHMASKLTVVK